MGRAASSYLPLLNPFGIYRFRFISPYSPEDCANKLRRLLASQPSIPWWVPADTGRVYGKVSATSFALSKRPTYGWNNAFRPPAHLPIRVAGRMASSAPGSTIDLKVSLTYFAMACYFLVFAFATTVLMLVAFGSSPNRLPDVLIAAG